MRVAWKEGNVEKTPSSRQVKGLMQANVCSVQVKIMKIIMKIIWSTRFIFFKVYLFWS